MYQNICLFDLLISLQKIIAQAVAWSPNRVGYCIEVPSGQIFWIQYSDHSSSWLYGGMQGTARSSSLRLFSQLCAIIEWRSMNSLRLLTRPQMSPQIILMWRPTTPTYPSITQRFSGPSTVLLKLAERLSCNLCYSCAMIAHQKLRMFFLQCFTFALHPTLSKMGKPPWPWQGLSNNKEYALHIISIMHQIYTKSHQTLHQAPHLWTLTHCNPAQPCGAIFESSCGRLSENQWFSAQLPPAGRGGGWSSCTSWTASGFTIIITVITIITINTAIIVIITITRWC